MFYLIFNVFLARINNLQPKSWRSFNFVAPELKNPRRVLPRVGYSKSIDLAPLDRRTLAWLNLNLPNNILNSPKTGLIRSVLSVFWRGSKVVFESLALISTSSPPILPYNHRIPRGPFYWMLRNEKLTTEE